MHTCTCTCISMYVCMYVCMYMYVCIYVCMYVHVCAQDFPLVSYALACLDLHDINQVLQEVINMPKLHIAVLELVLSSCVHHLM